MSLDPRSLEKLQGVRPELANVIKEAANRTKFRVTEGLRTRERQATLVKARKSRTMNSRHLSGHAIDFIAIGEDGIATYDMDDMRRVADVIKAVAEEHGVKIQWGGDWPGAWDSPHVELDRKAYPATVVPTTTRVVEVAKQPPAAVTGGAVVGGAAVGTSSLPSLPAPPDLSNLSAWQSFGNTMSDIGGWITGHPILTAFCVVWAASMAFLPQIVERIPWLRSYRFS